MPMVDTARRHPGARRSVLVLALLALLATAAPALGQDAPPQTRLRYLVMPHPDDEASVWAHVVGSSSDHLVVVYATRGEETSGCRAAAEGGGPHWFQGPASPVGQPDLGEVNPLGTGTGLWHGRWTETCRRARIASTLAFLDGEAAHDPALPGGFPSVDEPTSSHVMPGRTRGGALPGRVDNGVAVPTSEVLVYAAANGRGTVLFFDLGDGDTTPSEVEWAMRTVRTRADELGLPDLPDGPAIGAYRNGTPAWDCALYDHPDHRAVHVALDQWELVDAPQLGRTCSHDPAADPALTAVVPDDVFVGLAEVAEDGQRVGSFQRRYGWLAATEWSEWFDVEDDLFSQVQHVWRRPGS